MPLPITEQYFKYENNLKKKGDNYFLLFNLGDWWEAYGETAKTLNKHLGTPIIRRRDVLCSGFPYHEKDKSQKILVDAGFLVIFAEQPKELDKD